MQLARRSIPVVAIALLVLGIAYLASVDLPAPTGAREIAIPKERLFPKE